MSTVMNKPKSNMTDRELINKLEKMDLPRHRIYELNKNNLCWLNRNINFRNSENKYFNEVVQEIQLRIKNSVYSN